MTDINAAIGLGQLRHLTQVTQRRAMLAQIYFDVAASMGIEELGIELPPPSETLTVGLATNWHMVQVLLPIGRLQDARAAVQAMHEDGIGTGVHYPAVHLFSFLSLTGLARRHASSG